MGRKIVRILNLGYLAAAAVSIWSLCTKPIFKTSVEVHMTPEKLGEVLQPLFESQTKSSPRTSVSRASEKSITDYITAERIADSFRSNDPEKNGFHLSIPITIEAKYAFDLKNEHVINEVITTNVNRIIKDTCDKLSEPLTNFVFSITEEFALEALETAINQQIQNATDGGEQVTSEEVKEIYDNVYNELKANNGAIPLSNLTDVIVHGKDGGTSALTILNKTPRYVYQECDPQPTPEQYAANPTEYFVKNESDKYANPEEYKEDVTYYTYIYEACVPAVTAEQYAANPEKYFVYDEEAAKYKSTDAYVASATYFVRKEKPYTDEDLDRVDIEGQMEDALREVPGLVETTYKEAGSVEEATFNATLKSNKYYISDGTSYTPASYGEGLDTLYVKEGETFKPAPTGITDFDSTLVSNIYFVASGDSYVEAKSPYSGTTKYYICESTVNDIDTALVALINQYLLKKEESEGSGAKAVVRTRVEQVSNSKSKDELNEALYEFAMKYIPLEQVAKLEESYGQYVPIVLLVLVGLVGFPWLLLGLVTLIRTLRKKKCWTKPWVVIVLAFPQLIFGIGVTYGAKYALQIAGDRVDVVKQLLEAGLTIELKTLCLVPSFVYLGVVVYSIIYAFFARRVKVQYKLEKRAQRRALYEARARRG